MKRIRIQAPGARREPSWREELPLDPRDPDVVRAKALARAGELGWGLTARPMQSGPAGGFGRADGVGLDVTSDLAATTHSRGTPGRAGLAALAGGSRGGHNRSRLHRVFLCSARRPHLACGRLRRSRR